MSVLTIVNTLREQLLNVESEDITPALQIQLATTICQCLPIPVQASAGAVASFNEHYHQNIRKVINDVNEILLIDVDKVMRLVKSIYTARYELVHGGKSELSVLNAITEAVVGETIGTNPAEMRNLTDSTFQALKSAVCGALQELEHKEDAA